MGVLNVGRNNSQPAAASSLTTDLRIERVEFIPLIMPLPKTFRGSFYFMTHRCTIITRIYTACGIVGECYNGDEYETQAAVLKILREEIAPRVVGLSAASPEICWKAALTRPSTSSATESWRCRLKHASIARYGTRSERPRGSRCIAYGAGRRSVCGSSRSRAIMRRARR
jgi:hypothetical protein